MIALFAAEEAEARALLVRLVETRAVPGPFPAHLGLLVGHPVLVVQTGVGKAAAAAAVAWAFGRNRPKAAFFAGVAGALAPELGTGELLAALDAVQWDVDLTPFGRTPGELATGERFVPADPSLVALLEEAGAERVGRVASGDRFVADPELAAWIRTTFAADAVEMEGAAALWVARRFGVPAALLRVISDAAGKTARLDFETFLLEGSQRMAEVLSRALGRLK